jgi:hypothetical protein
VLPRVNEIPDPAPGRRSEAMEMSPSNYPTHRFGEQDCRMRVPTNGKLDFAPPIHA